MGERAIFTTKAHVFQIDPETRKKWLPSSKQAVVVSYYYDPSKKTYRIIAIENSKALINSSITANMTFTKTSPKFGQWSDHRANTVYGLGFAAENDLVQFADKFAEAKNALRALIMERQRAAQSAASATARPEATTAEKPLSAVSSPPANASNSNASNNQDTGLADGETDVEKPSTTSIVQKEHKRIDLVKTEENIEFQPVSSSPSQKSPTQSDVTVHSIDQPTVSASVMEEKPHPSPNSGKKPATGIVLAQSLSLEAQVQQLKYENDKLKNALTTSSANGKKWEAELQTLKNNNARLMTALQESNSNVNKWKQQLTNYQEENTALKKKVHEMEASQHALTAKSSDDIDSLQKAKVELEDQVRSLEMNLQEKAEECTRLEDKLKDFGSMEETLSSISENIKEVSQERDHLKEKVSQLEEQVQVATATSNSRLQEAKEKHIELGRLLESVMELHSQMGDELHS